MAASRVGFVVFALVASLLWGIAPVFGKLLAEAGRVVPIAALFLGETITWQKGVGAAPIVAGVWLFKG